MTRKSCGCWYYHFVITYKWLYSQSILATIGTFVGATVLNQLKDYIHEYVIEPSKNWVKDKFSTLIQAAKNLFRNGGITVLNDLIEK